MEIVRADTLKLKPGKSGFSSLLFEMKVGDAIVVPAENKTNMSGLVQAMKGRKKKPLDASRTFSVRTMLDGGRAFIRTA